MKIDHRNAEAKSRDAFLDSKEGKAAQDASTLGHTNPNYYLRNRIERAYLAGIEAGKKMAKQTPPPAFIIWRN